MEFDKHTNRVGIPFIVELNSSNLPYSASSIILKAYQDFWEDTFREFKEVKYSSEYGDIYLTISWDDFDKQILEHFEQSVFNNSESTSKTEETSDIHFDFNKANLTLSEASEQFAKIFDHLDVIINQTEKDGEQRKLLKFVITVWVDNQHIKKFKLWSIIIPSYVNIFLYDFFLAANLAAPGVFSLYGSNAYPLDSCRFFYDPDLRKLGTDYLNSSWIKSIEKKWNLINLFPINQTWNWLHSIKKPTSLLAETGPQKLIFGLLHICLLADISSPISIVWIINTLEAFYQTPTALTKNYLEKRFLGFMGQQISHNTSKNIKKLLSELYEMRSKFVHGSWQILHPLRNERLEPRIGEQWKQIMKLEDEGMILILGSLQQLIKYNYKDLKFNENIEGIN